MVRAGVRRLHVDYSQLQLCGGSWTLHHNSQAVCKRSTCMFYNNTDRTKYILYATESKGGTIILNKRSKIVIDSCVNSATSNSDLTSSIVLNPKTLTEK